MKEKEENIMKKILVSLGLILLLTACSSTSDEVVSDMEVIVVLTSPDYPPYESIKPDGTYEGFDIDLMEALAAEMGVTVEWKEQSFDGIVAAIQTNQGDMAISGMNISEERKLSVDFSEIYKSDGNLYQAVAKKDDNMSSFADLSGKIIGVQTGTVQEASMNAIAAQYNIEVVSYPTFNTIIQDIINDRLDALVIDSTNAQTYADENDALMTFMLEVDGLDGKAGTAIAFPKGSEWVAKVNAALATLQANGTLDELNATWFPEE